MRLMRTGFIFIVVLGSIALAESTQPQIDIIIDAIKSHRDRLVTYQAEYEIKTLSTTYQGKDMFFSKPEEAVERVSKGSYLIDRENSRFKYETDRYDSWNVSLNKFEPISFKVSNDGEKHTLFQASKNHLFAAIKNERNMSQIGGNPRDFFNLTIKLLELIERDRDNLIEVLIIDTDMYKVVVKEPLEGGLEFSHEFILDPSFDWNVVSLQTYMKGKLASEQKIEYTLVDGISFVKSGYLHRHNSDNPNELYWSDTLVVDRNSIKINIPVKDEDFQINLPHGTRVYDHRYDLSFTIGGDKSIIDDVLSEPAIMFASGKEYDDLPQKVLSTPKTENLANINNIQLHGANSTAESTVVSQKKRYSAIWHVPILLGGIALIVSLVYRQRRKGVTNEKK